MPVEHEVQAKYVVKEGPALASFGRLAKAAERINSTFNRLSGIIGGVAAVGGSLGAAFGLKEIVDSTKEHLGMVKRISDLTKTDVRTADALSEAFEDVGIKGEDTERILLGMSRHAGMMDMQFQRLGMHVTGTRGMFQRLGIDIRKGIEPALVRMSKLYKEGRVDVAQIGIAFGVPRQQALNMVKLLGKGPEEIKKMIEEGKKAAIGEETMKQYSRMRSASLQAQSALKRMQIIIGSELLPVLADLMEDASEKIKSWLPEVRKFGRFLRDNLQMALGIIIKIGKVLLANYALMKMTGMGMTGWAGRGLAFVRGGGAPGGLAGRVVTGAAGLLGGGGGMGPVTQTMAIVIRVVSMLGRLTALGAVALVVWKAFDAIKSNALGVRDVLLAFWKRMTAHFAVIGKLLGPVIKAFSGDGPIGKFFTVVVVDAITMLAAMIDTIMGAIETIIIAVKMLFSKEGIAMALLDPQAFMATAVKVQQAWHTKALQDQTREEQERLRLEREKAAKTPDGRIGAPNYDFRNSRFDITQKFEEGFDPDRIALAFANDLANLGEVKVGSLYAPMTSTR